MQHILISDFACPVCCVNRSTNLLSGDSQLGSDPVRLKKSLLRVIWPCYVLVSETEVNHHILRVSMKWSNSSRNAKILAGFLGPFTLLQK